MRREATFTSLPSRMSLLMLAGTRSAGKMVGLRSGIPVGGSSRTGAATVLWGATTCHTSRTPTLAWTSETSVVKVPTIAYSWWKQQSQQLVLPGCGGVGNASMLQFRCEFGDGPSPQFCHALNPRRGAEARSSLPIRDMALFFGGGFSIF